MNAKDRCLAGLGRALRGMAGVARAKRPNPAGERAADLTDAERRHAAGLMRVNHCGEVCAQALYEGHALAARDGDARSAFTRAAREEEDHLAWCRQRLRELDARPSRLDPAFYVASFALGAATGLLGRRLSLGFVAATEEQVQGHLEDHLERLPASDHRSRAILETMRDDEARHGEDAARAGGVRYPALAQRAMRLASKAMTAAAYRF